MWEIPFYLIIAPSLTLLISLMSSIKFNLYFFGPLIVFIILNIPTILLPLFYQVGWVSLFGWAVFYTVIASIISLIVSLVKCRVQMKRMA